MDKKIILLVEDNKDDADLTIRAFHKNNILNEIVLIDNGEDAIDWLFFNGKYSERDKSLKPEMILLDLKLPKVSGLEVLQKIKNNENTKSIPVVILTTSKEEQDVINSYQFYANSYIRKPVNFNEFKEAIKQLELYWLILNQHPDK